MITVMYFQHAWVLVSMGGGDVIPGGTERDGFM
jgi:hypothetical protein